MPIFINQNVSRFAHALMVAMLLQAAGPAGASDQTPVDLDSFKEIKVAPGVAQADNLIGTVLPFLQDHPESTEGLGKMDVQVRKSGSGFQVNIIKDGYLDDSVRGEHFVGHVIMNSEGRWELLSMHVKAICYRGPLSKEGRCPKRAF